MSRAPETIAPDVFSYVDFRAYLRDWRAAREAATGRPYSLGMFARKADAPKTVVQAVARGARKLLPPYVDRFIAAFELDAEEAAFFVLMVRYTQAGSESERQAVRVEMVRYPRCFRATEAGLREVHTFLDPLRTAIFELASVPSFRADAEWIASVIRHPPATAEQVREALDGLLRAGLLLLDDQGVPRPFTPEIVTEPVSSPEVGLVLNKTHAAAIRTAEAELTAGDGGLFAGVVGALPVGELAGLRQDVMDFQWRIIGLLRAAAERANDPSSPTASEPRVVTQFTSQLFSLKARPPTTARAAPPDPVA